MHLITQEKKTSFSGLDYEICTTYELERFFRDRKRDSKMVTEEPFDREELISELQWIDATAKFRFEDMLPELRLHVYEKLFTLSSDLTTLPQPQILATCKLMKREAQPILDQSMIGITLVRISAPAFIKPYGVRRQTRVNSGPVVRCALDMPLLYQLERWSKGLESAERVIVDVRMPGSESQPAYAEAWVNRQLYLMATRLGPSSTRKVKVRFHDVLTPSCPGDFLWPLSTCVTRDNLLVEGLTADRAQHFNACVGWTTMAPTGLRNWLALRVTFRELQRLLAKAGIAEDDNMWELDVDLAPMVTEARLDGLWDRLSERELATKIEGFEEDLAAEEVQRLKRQAEKVLAGQA